ncbi:MAG: hypothetical protein A3D96_05835 [Chlamydiae bacterium RIFCSPHIGHO2_12_FULL_44_59]|nr:MAG: hypothetical protein A2796_03660 [Chlamydiae bacterium RIFCSPHIGHO2_01_FULL_44_39]OGN57519.1 MAG: hypothetical protein A3C42_01970 [Chlamydiae bacterium RIFCSPHIGHO2_02_FULL_45_9]OGN61150.1 MAG: hypothetical protein A3D96_05835 [Chlamydiae bacterium RIFCSPHIGHO2_12_FULL_44_59]OGN65620.1 MAG: hypothetical protein A2978_06640 [Chlamydiae bacterium RIFCSPLOWO2_01_FULL_44_52]OGN68097.1 MAG: hypothetical protein A3I67_05310 [Chlamydiae bacterium RIFCSPLOWO2_02_FULL_45_22]OGN68986.1 MAG: hyp
MKFFFLFLLPFLVQGGPNDGSILLHNDTTMILTAVVQASDGSFLGQFSIQPGQQRNFITNMYNTHYEVPGTPNISLTPYTVTWQCPSEGIFSLCTNVSPGAYVKATICEKGTHFCAPKKKIEKKAPASHLQKVQ